jgi:hypothetical protein
MKIGKNSVVTLSYRVLDKKEHLLIQVMNHLYIYMADTMMSLQKLKKR